METMERLKTICRIVVLLAAVVFIVMGVARGEMSVVFTKAVKICMECIGLG